MAVAPDAVTHLVRVLEPALAATPASFLPDLRTRLRRAGIQRAVEQHDTPRIFDFAMDLVALQGISDAAANAVIDRRGNVGWRAIEAALAEEPECPRLRSYWSFSGCGFRKHAWTCGSPSLLDRCPLPQHEARKGDLAVAAHSLFLFMRDVCGGDLVGWIDRRLAEADPGFGVPDRRLKLRAAVLEPLTHVHGIGNKVGSMLLAELLLGGAPERERWLTAGASMIVVDRLVHSLLGRAGVLRRAGAEHPYGPACYRESGCAALLEAAAAPIDARRYHPDNPTLFPRFVQHAAWHLCAEAGLGLCNARRIPSAHRCQQRSCPAYRRCERLPIRTD